MRPLRTVTATAGILLTVWAAAAQPAADDSYRKSVETWRQEREASLKSDDGWLTVAGLFFLKEGMNRVGTDPNGEIVLPAGSAPAQLGNIEYRKGKTIAHITADAPVTIAGQNVREMELRSDAAPGRADVIVIGDVSLWVHMSGRRHTIRVRDKNSPIRRSFTGCRWFPIDERYRIEGRFIPYDAPKHVELVNILGDVEEYTSPGQVAFTLGGRELRMEPVLSSRGRFWFVFRDQTSGKETYGAARFVYADPPGPDGKVVLDFNRAYNPPCAFNPYTTCPLPTPQNRLPIRIEAGERDYPQHRRASP